MRVNLNYAAIARRTVIRPPSVRHFLGRSLRTVAASQRDTAWRACASNLARFRLPREFSMGLPWQSERLSVVRMVSMRRRSSLRGSTHVGRGSDRA